MKEKKERWEKKVTDMLNVTELQDGMIRIPQKIQEKMQLTKGCKIGLFINSNNEIVIKKIDTNVEKIIKKTIGLLQSGAIQTIYNEPQAILDIGNDKTMEVILAKKGLYKDQYHYEIRLFERDDHRNIPIQTCTTKTLSEKELENCIKDICIF